jgi:hypothetical protein
VRPYRCFLVRCRLEEEPGQTGLRGQPAGQPTGQRAWRFTVQQAGAGGARRSFACFDDVAAHMRAELASCGALAGDEAESYHTSAHGAQERRQKE